MSEERPKPNDSPNCKRPVALLEPVAAGVLLLVLAAVGWIIQAASPNAWLRLPSLAAEVIVVLGLLVSALLLVSIVALRQTRS